MSSFIPGGAEDPGLSHSTGLGPDLGVQGLQPLINGQVCLSETQAAGILLSHPHPCLLLLSALSGLLRTSLFLTSIIYTRVHKRDGFQRVIIWSTFFYKEMQALTWKSLQEPAHHSERSVSSGARQTWV